ncbi:MAG TPA: CapA family protein [Desertimonas sp.]|nr:CapA family protein [Desertimonas sp.]
MHSRLPPLAGAVLCLAGCATATDASPPAGPVTVAAATSSTSAVTTSTSGATTSTSATTASAIATSTTAAPPVTPAPTAGDGALTLAFTGDALWHSPLWRQAERNFAGNGSGAAGMDFTPMLARLQPVVANADVGVCHLETPIAPDGQFTTFPLYGVPPDVVTAIANAGFDRCSTASNHTVDRGTAGIDRTVAVLEAHGLGQSGMARTPAEIAPQVFVADGFRVAHLSYTFGYNGLRLPPGEEWRSALIDPQRIIADATEARRLGAEVVIVSMHWGIEGRRDVTPEQRAVAELVTASGTVDLIVGHHAHVLQPIEQINGVWVIFGLGNMISNLPTGPRWPAACQDGAVAVVTITKAPDGTAVVAAPVVHPTWVDRLNGWNVHLVQQTLADPALPEGLRAQLDTSLRRTSEVLGVFIAA